MGSWPAPYGMNTPMKRSALCLINGIHGICMISSFQAIPRPSPWDIASSWESVFFRMVPA